MRGTGPAEGYEAFVRASTVPLLRVAWLLTGDHHAAQDLVQETHVRMAGRWEQITGHDADPIAYARTVLHRLHVDAWRRRVRRPERLVDTAPERAVGDGSGEADLRLTVTDALARLTSKQRSVLVLRYLEDRTEVETAAVLGCSVSTVKSQARHAIERLRVLNPDLVAELSPVRTEA
ncbi:SigE family RNA polymerase sigma factor [Oryzobacter telluris]|uniref:SigE family RNA polymerase sigma factor n=1 Tax=Oryzobacter telluris TaxID=3149179 RepID=UPI00370D34D9